MSQTNSWAWPNMIDVTRNVITIYEDNRAIVNRSKLLILTEPTELYNELDFGVGLKRHLWQYNTENQKAIIRDRIVDQLRLHEPCVNPDDTHVSDGLLFTGSDDPTQIAQEYNKLKMTVSLSTIFGDTAEINLNDMIV